MRSPVAISPAFPADDHLVTDGTGLDGGGGEGKIDGSCGSSVNGTFSTEPSTDLCAAGIASSVTVTGPWSWTCAGVNGGSTAMCSAAKSSTSKPGDCDNNSTVGIDEVQSAINMYLGLKLVRGCVDVDDSGGVSIAEVRLTFNAFLGH